MDLKAQEAEALYRPAEPNRHWQLGAIARMAQMPRTSCPLTYPGFRWEWEAGWDYEDQRIGAAQ